MSDTNSDSDSCATLVSNITLFVDCRIDQRIRSVKIGVDNFYLIFAGALVFFMQVGFAMLCAGSVRSKNARNVLLWNLLDSAGGAVAYWLIGYAFSYGGDDCTSSRKTFIGHRDFLTTYDIDYSFWFFEFAFACATSSIVAGAIAERAKMSAYLLYSFFLVGFVYPVVAHSFWSCQGFFSNTNPDPLWGSGAFDFAGSGAVHMVGGVAALVMAIVIGPRRGRFYDSVGKRLPEPQNFQPHSVTLQFLGTFALWFGWYGFNSGSSLSITSSNRGKVASLAAINTTIAAASGGLSALFTEHFLYRWKTGLHTYDTTVTMNGVLTGLVAVTGRSKNRISFLFGSSILIFCPDEAPCGSVWPWAAFVIGIVAGWSYLLGSKVLVYFRIDDAVDAVPVHMIGGAWGLISTGLFSPRHLLIEAFGRGIHEGWFYAWVNSSGDFTLIGIQLLAVIWIFGWVSIVFGIFTLVLSAFGLLRADAYAEEIGMDLSIHKGSAYESDNSESQRTRKKYTIPSPSKSDPIKDSPPDDDDCL